VPLRGCRLDHASTGLTSALQARVCVLALHTRASAKHTIAHRHAPGRGWPGHSHFAVFCDVLDRLQQAQRLVHAAADGQVVDRRLQGGSGVGSGSQPARLG